MSRPVPRARFRLRLAAVLGVAVVAAVAVAWATEPAAGLWPSLWPALACLAAGVIAAFLLFRPSPGFFGALADALESIREGDYSVRLEEERSGAFAPVAARFNALAAHLRNTRNDVYQKELLLESVLETAPTAILVCDETSTVAIANTAARDLLGDGRRLVGLPIDDVLARCRPEVRDAIRNPEDALFTVERDGENETYLAVSRWFELNTRRHRVHLIRPFTRELARREVEVWKKALRIISHELSNSLAPVSSLIHSARSLAGKPDAREQLDKVLAAVAERAVALRQFLEGYAQFARLPKPEKKEVPWESFLTGVRALYPFSVQGALPPSPGWFDPAQLQQVLINLLKNAVESGSAVDDCAVRISALPEGGAELLVMDRGAGMPDEVRRHALEPFYSTKKRGSGLGLPLCREIVEAHGGRIWVLAREGGGTSVRCWLPGRA